VLSCRRLYLNCLLDLEKFISRDESRRTIERIGLDKRLECSDEKKLPLFKSCSQAQTSLMDYLSIESCNKL